MITSPSEGRARELPKAWRPHPPEDEVELLDSLEDEGAAVDVAEVSSEESCPCPCPPFVQPSLDNAVNSGSDNIAKRRVSLPSVMLMAMPVTMCVTTYVRTSPLAALGGGTGGVYSELFQLQRSTEMH
ncbi:hypothetical protein KC323_g78 [Hortaea werneckii]|nr:hypothetical protein KC323_g78 [Hortaea werneckii]